MLVHDTLQELFGDEVYESVDVEGLQVLDGLKNPVQQHDLGLLERLEKDVFVDEGAEHVHPKLLAEWIQALKVKCEHRIQMLLLIYLEHIVEGGVKLGEGLDLLGAIRLLEEAHVIHLQDPLEKQLRNKQELFLTGEISLRQGCAHDL